MSEQTVLFDAPGPRALRRYRVVAGVGGALSLAVFAWVLVKLGEKGNLSGAKWSPFLQADTWSQYIVPGLIGTLKAAAISIVLAGALGLLLGIGRLSELAPIRWVSSVVVEFFRAVPVLLMMLFTLRALLHQQHVPALAALAGCRRHGADALQRRGDRGAGAGRCRRPAPRPARGGALDRPHRQPDAAVDPAAAGADGDAAGAGRAARRGAQGLGPGLRHHLRGAAQQGQPGRHRRPEHRARLPGRGRAVHRHQLRADPSGGLLERRLNRRGRTSGRAPAEAGQRCRST